MRRTEQVRGQGVDRMAFDVGWSQARPDDPRYARALAVGVAHWLFMRSAAHLKGEKVPI